MSVFVTLTPHELQTYTYLWDYCNTSLESDAVGGTTGKLCKSLSEWWWDFYFVPPGWSFGGAQLYAHHYQPSTRHSFVHALPQPLAALSIMPCDLYKIYVNYYFFFYYVWLWLWNWWRKGKQGIAVDEPCCISRSHSLARAPNWYLYSLFCELCFVDCFTSLPFPSLQNTWAAAKRCSSLVNPGFRMQTCQRSGTWRMHPDKECWHGMYFLHFILHVYFPYLFCFFSPPR